MLAACPIFLCGWLALHARTYQDPFEVQAGTKEQDAVVYAYEPIVREAHLTFKAHTGEFDRERLLNLAAIWESAAARGELRPLTPISFEDSPTEGIRGEVLHCKNKVVNFLMDDAKDLAHSGRTREAAKETLMAIRLSESMKYGDFNSIGGAAGEEQREVALLSSFVSRLSRSSRREVQRELQVISNRHGDMIAVTQESTARLYDYQRRISRPVGVSEIRQTSMLSRRIRAEGKSAGTLQLVRKNCLEARDEATLDHLSSLKFAWACERDAQRKIEVLLRKISKA